MTITISGRFSFQNASCEKCGKSISLWNCPEKVIKCEFCGASYEITNRETSTQGIKLICDFTGFECIWTGPSKNCANTCPAPNMYCKDHLTDKEFDAQNNSILYWESLIKKAQENIDEMNESKRIWLTVELSDVK